MRTRLITIGLIAGALGLLWIATYYLSQAELPFPALGPWNLIAAGVPIVLGFITVVVGLVQPKTSR